MPSYDIKGFHPYPLLLKPPIKCTAISIPGSTGATVGPLSRELYSRGEGRGLAEFPGSMEGSQGKTASNE